MSTQSLELETRFTIADAAHRQSGDARHGGVARAEVAGEGDGDHPLLDPRARDRPDVADVERGPARARGAPHAPGPENVRDASEGATRKLELRGRRRGRCSG